MNRAEISQQDEVEGAEVGKEQIALPLVSLEVCRVDYEKLESQPEMEKLVLVQGEALVRVAQEQVLSPRNLIDEQNIQESIDRLSEFRSLCESGIILHGSAYPKLSLLHELKTSAEQLIGLFQSVRDFGIANLSFSDSVLFRKEAVIVLSSLERGLGLLNQDESL